MKKILTVFLILFVQKAFGQEATMKPYGFASLNVPSHNNQFTFDWARLGIIASPAHFNGADSISIQYEYDVFTASTKYCLVDLTKRCGDLTLNLVAGKQLDPIQWLYPGSSSYQLTRYPDAEALLKVYDNGLGFVIQQGKNTVRATYFNDVDGIGYSGSVNWEELISVFGNYYTDRSKGSFGFVVDALRGSRIANLRLGLARFSGPSGRTVFIQNESHLNDYASLWIRLERTNGKDDFLGGLTVKYSYRSYLKVYSDSKTRSLETRVTFAFY